jgi:hypothetical protein
MTSSRGLSSGTILRIVNTYIGVSGGYLSGFNYRGIEEFYPMYCDLEINPWDYSQGTTRLAFIAVLQASPPDVQSKILRGLLDKVPQPTAEGKGVMSREDLLRLAARLEGLPIASPNLANTREVVDRALQDAETLLTSRDAISAVDRLHTALHGYLKGLCDDAGIAYEPDAAAPRLLKLLREKHPSLQPVTHRASDTTRILTAMGTAIDAVRTIRNTASIAHPNETLVDPADAMLVVNAVRTILHYLDAKLGD